MKKIIIWSFCILISSTSSAQKVMVVENKDHTKTTFVIDNILRVHFEEIVFKFEYTSLNLFVGSQQRLNLISNTDKGIVWNSSNPSIASVDNTGLVKAIKKGVTIIKAITSDGLQCQCEIIVSDITDYISASSLGGACVIINDLIQQGSQLYWKFSNNSSEWVRLKTLQLIDGVTGQEGNLMSVDVDVEAGSSVSYSTTIGLLGIHRPVTCRFRYEYNEKEYYIDATY